MASHKITRFSMTKFLFEQMLGNLKSARECNFVDCYPNSKRAKRYDDDYATLCNSESDYYEDCFEDLNIMSFVDPKIPVTDISMMITNLQNKASFDKEKHTHTDHTKSIDHLIHITHIFMKQKHLI